MDSGLRQRYLDYLEVLNDRRFEDLDHFVADHLTYNGSPQTREHYQDQRRREADLIPDLRFDVALLVVEENRVACLLRFDCTPEGEFLGFPVSGLRIQFTEHVFYRFDHGRIVEVRSLLDREAIRHQTPVL